MAIIKEVIRINDNNTLSFGNYKVTEKQKVADFKFGEDVYKIKTHNEVTKLEKNDKLLLETVPGASIHNFLMNSDGIAFEAYGVGNTEVVVELQPDTEYEIKVDDVVIGTSKTNFSGKLNASCELNTDNSKKYTITAI